MINNSLGQDKILKYDNAIYEDDIKTVLVYKKNDKTNQLPLINLSNREALSITFDELNAEIDFYQFTVVHCDAQWNPSELEPFEYIEGTFVNDITNFRASTNTYIPYIHYQFDFPNNNIRITKSGNYLLKVYRNFNESDLIITRRICVYDPLVKVTGQVQSPTEVFKRYTHHEIDFDVDLGNYNVPNPYQDIDVYVIQNLSWDKSVSNLKPRMINGTVLDYDYDSENTIEGGNEYRAFDLRSIRNYSLNVASKTVDSFIHAMLRLDEISSHKEYLFFKDYNGRMVIENQDGAGNDWDADYIEVTFSLESPKLETPVYIYGMLSDWEQQEAFEMQWIDGPDIYQKTMLLKQGYYNYLYTCPNEKTKQPSFVQIEGTHFQTENDYMILVYHKNQLYGYDELVGFTKFNSADERSDKY